MEERLQKIIARAGIASRRKAEEMIEQGLVSVNGRVATLGEKADPENDAIKVEGRRIQPHTGEHRYLLLNKPKNVMSTLSDPEGRPTVIEFIPPAFRKALVPVGRLDFGTEGLLLLTDDGEFAQRVAHPRYGSVKIYEVKVKGRPDEETLERLRTGVYLEGKKTAPAKITPRHSPVAHRRRPVRDDDEGGENSWWVVQLTEGRTRQIREMFQQVGHPVHKLRRVAIGPLRDPDLPPGSIRELTDREVQALLKTARDPKEAKEKKERAAKPATATDGTGTAAASTAPAPRRPSVPSTTRGPAAKAPVKPAKKTAAPPEEAPAAKAPAPAAPARRPPARPAPLTRAPSQRPPAKRAPSRGVPAKGAPSKGAPSKGAPSKGVPSKGAPSKRAPSGKAPAARRPGAAPRGPGGPRTPRGRSPR